jgi:hypothetical protein
MESGLATTALCHLQGAAEESMEFATNAEAAAYRMLTQVLQTHLATQTMSVHTALAACERLLALVCLQLETAGDDLQDLVSSTLGGLKQELSAQQGYPTVPLYTADTPYTPDALLRGDPALWLSTVLSRLLDDARREQGITVAGSWRIAIRLTADLLSVFLLQLKYTREEVNAMIDGRLSPTLSAYLRICNAQFEKQHQKKDQLRLLLKLLHVVQGIFVRLVRLIFPVKPPP